jgi:hypothetical protein
MNRRVLIVADAIVTGLCALAVAANIALGEPGSIVAGICALVVGTCAAVTTYRLIASGGWSRSVTAPGRMGSPNGSTPAGREPWMRQDA